MHQRSFQKYVGLMLALLLIGTLGVWADDDDDDGGFTSESKVISAKKGGVINVDYDGKTYARFIVPRKALKEDTEISVDALIYYEDEEFLGFAVNFGPDGLQFKKPYAILSLEKPLLKLFRGSRILIWDEDGNLLWSSDTIDKKTKRVGIRITHFSLYYFERR